MMSVGWEGYPETGLGWPDVMAPVSAARRVAARERAGAGSRRAPAGWPLESGLGFRLGRVHRMLRGAWEVVITDLGLSPPQAALLRAVAEQPGSGLRELARRMHTDAMNAKRLADHLERTGVIASASDPGHRQRRVFRPTGKGTVVAGELARRAAAQDRRVARLLGAADLAQLQNLLNRLESVLASGLPPASGLERHRAGSQGKGGGR
jgi:DNA-binding MarR family transcriptional regulator